MIDWRFAEGRSDRYTQLATTLVKLQMDVIVVSGTAAVIVAKEATKTIPIVFLNVTDPLGNRIVASLAAPEGNMTGVVQDVSPEIAGKLLQLLKDAVPQATRVAILLDPDEPGGQMQWWHILERAAQTLQIALQPIAVRRASELDGVFEGMNRDRSGALFVTRSALFITHRKRIMELAARARLPTVSNWRETTELGGLMSYGAYRPDLFRHAAIYVAKILKGAKPGDLPVEQPTKFDLVINLKTAMALGLTIPRSLLPIADEVIE